jgi:cellulose synthase operon protein C
LKFSRKTPGAPSSGALPADAPSSGAPSFPRFLRKGWELIAFLLLSGAPSFAASKSSHAKDPINSRKGWGLKSFLLLGCFAAALTLARAAMPEWVQNIEFHSLVEAAIFRSVSLPGGPVTIKRPPAETVPALADLVKQHPQQADLYSLKALEEEQKLDFTAAEADWKLYLQNAADKFSAQMALADFYHRRHRPQEEVNALSSAARMAAPAAEKLTVAPEQRSWQAFERIFQVIGAQALGKGAAVEQYNAWTARYPQEQSLYGRYFEFLLEEKDFKGANDLIAKYRGKFPGDEVFPTRARALLAYKQGSVQEGLAIYEKNFQPLWPPELVKNYFDLLRETRSLRSFLDQAHAALGRNPDDLNAAARLFYYYQQQGDLAAAQQAITAYRVKKDARKAAWTPQELYTFARLLDAVHLYPEAARYYFALYNAPGTDSPEKALAGLANILLVAPEQPVRFGTGDLSMYKDIVTMDAGPGYLNGILSLLLNTTSPGAHYSEEEQRAVPYFHRSRAAELVALFDKRFPGSQERPALHARLIEAYANYGEDAFVLSAGNDFLNAFPSAPQRNQVALLMADAYARTGNTRGEFAIYDSLLQELARKAEGVPLGEHLDQQPASPEGRPGENSAQSGEEGQDGEDAANATRPIIHHGADSRRAFILQNTNPVLKGVRSPDYQRVLDRYISRLVSLHQVPAALAVWRQELDRNPNDPGLYEKFAAFLEGNQLGAEEEAVYKRAIQQFPGTNWYHKLARWYLKKKRQQDLQALSEQVSQVFSGSDLQAYLGSMPDMPANFQLHFNQLAHQRFPHNLVFVRNLAELYHSKRFYNQAAWEALLRNYWFQDEMLRSRFFEYLSSSGKLEPELEALRNTSSGATDWAAQAASNPAGASFIAEAELWRSHFESGAPVIAAVARLYPADAELGERASSVYRSLAYFNPRNTDVAVQIETNLLQAAPADRNRLARIGDIYSDRELFAKAAPYWNKMPDTEPGRAASYEEAATVFWDYYFFEDALRLLNLGRARLHDDALYSYQVGAIYESQRDYPRAIDEYLKGALAETTNLEARERLLQLAGRKPFHDAVDAATAKAVAAHNYDWAAVQLRVDMLNAQQRYQEVPAFLVSVLDRTSSVETLESIESMARQKSLEDVRQHALERQIAVSTDPVRRLELRYTLVNFYEQKKDLAAAQQNVEALYKENSRIMGVVRSTVDFYSRNKQQQRAIDVLAQAARDSYPALKAQFTFEAARKMTDVDQYEPARKLLLGLLQGDPFNGEYLAAAAETYARAGDNAGLRDFYQEKIKSFQKAGLSADERKARIAGLRRGLLPALTALKDYAGGVDQYIEIINAYPEDAALVSEAAAYAQRYQRKDQLQNFYAKTVAASPRDSRWAVVLARVQTSYEDFEAAVRTYAQAIKIRPDRTDLVSAKAAMEERLLRFDEAAADYSSLYELAYHDAQWMEKVAEVRARQGRTEQAVQALKTALIDGRPEAPGKYFTVAARLEGWGMLAPAREYSEKGVAAAGQDLLANPENHAGAQTYTRTMTRLRQQDAAYQKLQAAMEAARQLPPLTERVAKGGLEAATNTELHNSMLATRTNNARNGMAACMREMGSAAGRFFTPEEKVEFAKFLEARNAAMNRNDAYSYLLPSAEKAGLAALQAKFLYEQLAARPAGDVSSYALEQLQTARLKLMELGQQMEQIALARKASYSTAYLGRAQQAYKLAGSAADELRVLQAMEQGHALSSTLQGRYFELLLEKDPQRLVQLAAAPEGRGDAAVNFLVAHADAKLALPAVDTRSASEPAIWRPAYLALTGLYFGDQSLAVQNAFAATVADETIAQRLARNVNRKQALAGDVWFYYASRYGEYLGAIRKGDPEDFLPAEIEHTPARAAAYFTTALYYEDAGDLNRAIGDYQHVVELDSQRIDAHNRLAGIYWKQKHQEQALSEWKRALELLNIQTTTSRTPETFWGDFAATVNNLAGRKLQAQFQPDVEQVLHNYVKRNGEYRVMPLLQAVLPQMESSAAGALPLQLSADAPQKLSFLRAVIADNRHYKINLEPVYRRALELAQESARKAEGTAGQLEQGQFEGLQIEWLQYLLENKKYDLLRTELAALPASMREQRAELIAIQLKLAARTAGLDAILEGYRADAVHAPEAEVLRKTATELQQAGDGASARKILEFVFTREIEDHQLTAANMLGLAEIRMQAGDMDGAVALLRRMTLVVGGPFENQDAAAALLVRTGHPAQAVGFLEELVKAIPWNAQYRGRLAQARIAAGQNVESAQKELASIVSDKAVPYEDRAAFANGLQSAAPASLGSAELDYLARGAGANINPDQPFFFAARMKAARGLPAKEQVRLLRDALEDAPARDSARVPLLKAATETGDYFQAIAVMQSMTNQNWRYDLTRGASDENEEAMEAPAQTETETEDHSPGIARLPAKERAEINRDLGMAYVRIKSLAEALPYLQQAYRLEPDPKIKAQINREVQQIRFTQRRQAANQLRQPEIHSELEQQRIVRPRLPEQPVFSPPRTQGQPQKGAGQ